MDIIGSAFDYIWNSYIRTIRFSDILDIVIIAVIIYKVMVFVSRTGSARVIKGILLLIAVMWLSTLLELTVISFLMGKTFELGFLALLILFQPELRRMLERVGSSNITQIFGRAGDNKELEAAILQVVDAMGELSKSKTGALIVFEREIKMDDAVKTGTVISAMVNSELLRNIFYPNTPMHDGAMIIRDAKVVAAGCMLPLSSNPNLSRELGMRHRAALGISEVTDALVAVVSEETGSLSVALDGMLKRHLALDTLEMLLRRELMPVDEGIKGIKGKTIFSKIAKRNGSENEAGYKKNKLE